MITRALSQDRPHAARGGGLQGSAPGQSSTACRGADVRGGGLQGSVSRQGSRALRGADTRVRPQGPVLYYSDVEEEEEHEEDEEECEEDEDLDEMDGTQSRFPAGFQPMRMCRWFTSGNCWQWGVCSLTGRVNCTPKRGSHDSLGSSLGA